MQSEITRRRFLGGAGSLLALSMLQLRCSRSENGEAPGEPAVTGAALSLAYDDWQDVYRQPWTWDKVVKGAHHVVNCVSACPFNLFVKDGIVLREEQNAVMEANNENLPDFNPRGCQKGVCYSQLMYGPSRIRYPLKRVGARGEGRWKRISWD